MKIIETASKCIGFDIDSSINNVINSNNDNYNDDLLINFLHEIFSNHANKSTDFVVEIYFHNKLYSIPLTREFLNISKASIPYNVEHARNNRINNVITDRFLNFH